LARAPHIPVDCCRVGPIRAQVNSEAIRHCFSKPLLVPDPGHDDETPRLSIMRRGCPASRFEHPIQQQVWNRAILETADRAPLFDQMEQHF
jgi:hypothetical protein